MSLLDEEKDWINKSQQIAVKAWAEKNIECAKYAEHEPQQSHVTVTENSISYRGSRITIKDFIPSVVETIVGPTTIVRLDVTVSTYLPKYFICNSKSQNLKTFKLETYGTFSSLEIEHIKFENFTNIKFSGTNLSKIRGEVICDPSESHLHLCFDGTLIENFNDINGLVPVWNISDITLDISNTKLAHYLAWEVSDIDKVSHIIDSQYAWAYKLKQIKLSQKILLVRSFEYNLDGSKKSKWKLSLPSESYFKSIKFDKGPF